MRYGPNILQPQVFILFIQFKPRLNQDCEVVIWLKRIIIRTLCSVFLNGNFTATCLTVSLGIQIVNHGHYLQI